MGRVMVVEDDSAVKELLREILERAGHDSGHRSLNE